MPGGLGFGGKDVIGRKSLCKLLLQFRIPLLGLVLLSQQLGVPGLLVFTSLSL